MEGLVPYLLGGCGRVEAAAVHLISDIGSVTFPSELFRLLNGFVSTDHCGAYRLGAAGVQNCGGFSVDGSEKSRLFTNRYLGGGFWISDPAIDLITTQAGEHDFFFVDVDMRLVGEVGFREEFFLSQQLYHRLMICRRVGQEVAILDLVRSASNGPFTAHHLETFGASCSILIPAVFKHCEISSQHESEARILLDQPAMEARLAERAVDVPKREREVAARVLRGLSTAGIALDLGVTEHTVATYRKRLYQRLNISGRQELCAWFLQSCQVLH